MARSEKCFDDYAYDRPQLNKREFGLIYKRQANSFAWRFVHSDPELRLCHAVFDRPSRQLGAVVQSGFAKHIADVTLDRALAHV